MGSKVRWDLYEQFLGVDRRETRNYEIMTAQRNHDSEIRNSPVFQPNATLNGESLPMAITRSKTMKCQIALLSGDVMNIGDLIDCFGEKWLVVESYVNEYDLVAGEAWLCNHIFRFQNHTPEIIERHGILDDGTYSNSGDKRDLPMTLTTYYGYISQDSQTKKLYVDKRLAIGIISDSRGDSILEVYKVKSIDTKSKNFGDGSHLAIMRLERDVYAPELDNISKLICNYIPPVNAPPPNNSGYDYKLIMSGQETIRVGTARKYTVSVDDSSLDLYNNFDIVWDTTNVPSEILSVADGETCTVTVPLSSGLIGKTFILAVSDASNKAAPASLFVEVIAIG